MLCALLTNICCKFSMWTWAQTRPEGNFLSKCYCWPGVWRTATEWGGGGGQYIEYYKTNDDIFGQLRLCGGDHRHTRTSYAHTTNSKLFKHLHRKIEIDKTYSGFRYLVLCSVCATDCWLHLHLHEVWFSRAVFAFTKHFADKIPMQCSVVGLPSIYLQQAESKKLADVTITIFRLLSRFIWIAKQRYRSEFSQISLLRTSLKMPNYFSFRHTHTM